MDLQSIRTTNQQMGMRRIVLVATADAKGCPHIAAAGHIEILEDQSVAVTEWFCPTTVANAETGRKISIVAWDPDTDDGMQLIGHVTDVKTLGVLDGYTPVTEENTVMPQIQRCLCIQLEKSLRFSRAPHRDEETG